MPRARQPARYSGGMKLVPLTVRNCAPDEMREKLNAVPFLAYHVETLSDGRKVCITKPGGKSSWGQMKADDFMVWIYDEAAQDRWRISHEEIYKDIPAKLENDADRAGKLVDLLHEVCEGTEPDDLHQVLRDFGCCSISRRAISAIFRGAPFRKPYCGTSISSHSPRTVRSPATA